MGEASGERPLKDRKGAGLTVRLKHTGFKNKMLLLCVCVYLFGSQVSPSTWKTRVELRLTGLHSMHFSWLVHLADLRLDFYMQRCTGDSLDVRGMGAWETTEVSS